MFLHLCVILFTGGCMMSFPVLLSGSMLVLGVSLQRGPSPEGVSLQRGWLPPGDVSFQRGRQTHPLQDWHLEAAIKAGGTHPTGMRTCFVVAFRFNIQCSNLSIKMSLQTQQILKWVFQKKNDILTWACNEIILKVMKAWMKPYQKIGKRSITLYRKNMNISNNLERIEFCAISTKLTILPILASKAFSRGKKVTSSFTQSDDHWFEGVMLSVLS